MFIDHHAPASELTPAERMVGEGLAAAGISAEEFLEAIVQLVEMGILETDGHGAVRMTPYGASAVVSRDDDGNYFLSID